MAKDNHCCCGDDHLDKENGCDSHDQEGCCEDHECGCDNGCGCDHDHHEEQVLNVVFDDGEEKACLVLAIIEYEEKEYVALLPKGQEDYYIYGYHEDETGVELIPIESEEEFNTVGDIFENEL
jgi:uncharacterized protein YrzB (UPF0473 family)